MPLAERLARLTRTPDEVAAAIEGRDDDAALSRPAADGWSAKEVVCHLRDVEELHILRFHQMLVIDDPPIFVVGSPPPNPEDWGIGGRVPFPLDPERWSRDRQYLRNDAGDALEAFQQRREEVLAFLDCLSPAQWERGCIHPEHGRLTYAEFIAGIAGHDDSHLEQIRQALK
jgi:hypothetical protein